MLGRISFLRASLYFAILSAAFPLALAFASDEATLERMDSSTLRVLCLSEDGNELGTGSGFVIDSGRHLVTNWHVVACTAEAGQAAVLISAAERGARDEPVVGVQVVSSDARQDLAVLKLERPLRRPSVTFASAASVRKLDPVFAYGFPGVADRAEAGDFADPSVTTGVVSRMDPASPDRDVPRLIQIDAAINPGNSGGPLFDVAGRVIGINTLKALTEVTSTDPAAGGAPVRVPLGEGVGWAVVSDELFSHLKRLGIHYQVESTRPTTGAHVSPVRLWWLMAAIAMGVIITALVVWRRNANPLEVSNNTPKASTSPPVAVAGRAKPNRAQLRGIAGPYAGTSIPFGSEPMAIGRDPAMVQLVIPATFARVSKRHAQISYDRRERRFQVEDCWSSHGTFINGEPLPPGGSAILKPGDRVDLATTEVAFEVDLT